MRITGTLLAVFMLSLPMEARDAAAVPPPLTSSAVQDTESLCNKLIAEARRIDDILRTITDTATADAAAAELAKCRESMQAYLSELEKLPFDAETTLIITTQMTALTHITQSYIPRVNELQQAGAFDSALLAEQLNKLLAEEEYPDEAPGDPLAQAYEKIEQLQDDAFYVLRKTQDSATAKDAASALRDIIARHSELQHEIAQTAENTTPTCAPHVTEDLESEFTRLKGVGFYGDPDLEALLLRYIKFFKP